MKHIKNFESVYLKENNIYSDIEKLTIEEFSFLREAMYAVKNSDSPSAIQAKKFFQNEENFDLVIDKLRKLLVYGSEIPPNIK